MGCIKVTVDDKWSSAKPEFAYRCIHNGQLGAEDGEGISGFKELVTESWLHFCPFSGKPSQKTRKGRIRIPFAKRQEKPPNERITMSVTHELQNWSGKGLKIAKMQALQREISYSISYSRIFFLEMTLRLKSMAYSKFYRHLLGTFKVYVFGKLNAESGKVKNIRHNLSDKMSWLIFPCL